LSGQLNGGCKQQQEHTRQPIRFHVGRLVGIRWLAKSVKDDVITND
jgi:hypothetical protein